MFVFWLLHSGYHLVHHSSQPDSLSQRSDAVRSFFFLKDILFFVSIWLILFCSSGIEPQTFLGLPLPMVISWPYFCREWDLDVWLRLALNSNWQASSKLAIFISLPPESWDYRNSTTMRGTFYVFCIKDFLSIWRRFLNVSLYLKVKSGATVLKS